jgi:predicted nucleic acid-binding protein
MLLDTSAYSAFLRGHEGIRHSVQRASEILLTPVVLGELRAGFRQGTRRERNEELLREFLSSPRMRVVPVDDETSDRYAEIVALLRRQGRPIPTNDIWIAASAMQYGSYLVTTDPHFEAVPQVIAEIHTPK